MKKAVFRVYASIAVNAVNGEVSFVSASFND